jgi:hypothetical protein
MSTETLGSRVRQCIDDIAAIPDHIQALAIIATGAILTVVHQQSTGQALIAAGLAMWKGKQQ